MPAGHGSAICITSTPRRPERSLGEVDHLALADWTGLERTTYSLSSLLSGNNEFADTTPVPVADARVELPVDYSGNFAYSSHEWSAAAEVGKGFGGSSFHGGYEQRVGRVELRGGARYTVKKWNPTGGVGFDITQRLSLDVAAFGTDANIERKRRVAIAASIRLNRAANDAGFAPVAKSR